MYPKNTLYPALGPVPNDPDWSVRSMLLEFSHEFECLLQKISQDMYRSKAINGVLPPRDSYSKNYIVDYMYNALQEYRKQKYKMYLEKKDSCEEAAKKLKEERIIRTFKREEEQEFLDKLGLTAEVLTTVNMESVKNRGDTNPFPMCRYRAINFKHMDYSRKAVDENKIDPDESKIKEDKFDFRRIHKPCYKCVLESCIKVFQDPMDRYLHFYFDHANIVLMCCGFKFNKYIDFLRHRAGRTLRPHRCFKAYECETCFDLWRNREEFIAHIKKCKFKPREMRCPQLICKQKFSNRKDGIEHFFNEHKGGALIIDKKLVTKASDIDFVNNPPMRWMSLFQCVKCCNQFTNDIAYNEHFDQGHPEHRRRFARPLLKCKCNQKFRLCSYQRNELLKLLRAMQAVLNTGGNKLVANSIINTINRKDNLTAVTLLIGELELEQHHQDQKANNDPKYHTMLTDATLAMMIRLLYEEYVRTRPNYDDVVDYYEDEEGEYVDEEEEEEEVINNVLND